VIHIVARPGGLWRTVTIVIGLLLFGGVFFLGLGLGAFSVMLAPSSESVILHQTYRDGRAGRIAILPIFDVIDSDRAEFARMAVDDILNDGGFDAVVLRVDSPGGGVTASDQIWAEVKRLKKAGLPVVASYGSVAASGGYYVSCGADHIMAEVTSITGSIGVIAQVFTMEGLADKVGIEPVTLVATGSPEKDTANDIFRAWDEKDREKVRIMLDAAFATFQQRVRDGRGNAIGSTDRVAAIADGSIYTAEQALAGGLIDGIGYLDDAIAEAERRASLSAGAARIIILKQPPAFFASGLFTQAPRINRATPPLDADAIRALANDLGAPRVMYLMH
jgi:protease-4